MYRAMSYMDRLKHSEPSMSLAIRDLVKPLFEELKEAYVAGASLAKSM